MFKNNSELNKQFHLQSSILKQVMHQIVCNISKEKIIFKSISIWWLVWVFVFGLKDISKFCFLILLLCLSFQPHCHKFENQFVKIMEIYYFSVSILFCFLYADFLSSFVIYLLKGRFWDKILPKIIHTPSKGHFCQLCIINQKPYSKWCLVQKSFS